MMTIIDDLREAATTEEESGGSKTTIASLRRAANEIGRLRVWINWAKDRADVDGGLTSEECAATARHLDIVLSD